MKKMISLAAMSLVLLSCSIGAGLPKYGWGFEYPVYALFDIYSELTPSYTSDSAVMIDCTKYMTKDMRRLWNGASRKSARSADMWIDYDPWISGQDYEVFNVRDAVHLDYNGSSSRIRLRLQLFRNSEYDKEMTVVMKYSRRHWLVDDIVFDSGVSLKRLASGYLAHGDGE